MQQSIIYSTSLEMVKRAPGSLISTTSTGRFELPSFTFFGIIKTFTSRPCLMSGSSLND